MQQLKHWSPGHAYVISIDQLVQMLSTDVAAGLSESEASDRIAAEGQNAIARESDVRPLKILLEQFKSSVVILLLVAAGISSMLQEYLQTAGIIVAVFINAAVGFFTEYRAKLSLEKLSRLAGAVARVRRDSTERLIPVSELVRGDILILQPGDRVPADLRLLEAPSLSIDESILTGESVPVWKSTKNEREWESGVLFQGTSVAGGRAKAVVIATGTDTRLGALATTTREIDDSATPLQTGLNEMGKKLTWLTLVICVIVAIVGVAFRGIDVLHMLETGIALAVAAIPEGLPVVATLALAIGIHRMVQKKALVRRLTAVETLGCTTVICTDKTGTLTENKMKVNQVVTKSGTTTFAGSGYDPSGAIDGCTLETAPLLTAAALCNDASLHVKDGKWIIAGDPTEGALVVAARKLGLQESKLAARYPRFVEIPFDLDRKRMSTVHASGADEAIVFCKGSPEILLPLCSHVLQGDTAIEIGEADRAEFLKENARMADMGLRVLAVARKVLPQTTICVDPENLESHLTLLGLVGMADSLRPHVEEAITRCRQAGIRVLMLTGDQQRTADAVAKNIGISEVLARVTPEMKLNVVRDLRAQGEIVAMTGDGVNDAPALKQSDIGIAMGESGSDLARDASDLVITDDNFATIVAAIEEGRAIYRNIKRAIAYLLTASLSSVFVVAIGILFSKELLLTPLQLLWLNLIMHVFPGIGLVMQRDTKGAMSIPPREPGEALLTGTTMRSIVARSVIVAVGTALAPILAHHGAAGAGDTSIFLAVVSLSLLLQSWSWLCDRSANTAGVTLNAGLLCNAPMLVTTLIGIALVLVALYFPPLSVVLQTQPLDATDWVVSVIVAVATFVTTLAFSKFQLRTQPSGRPESDIRVQIHANKKIEVNAK
jgi:P-type Ca2+ transporter type 2C